MSKQKNRLRFDYEREYDSYLSDMIKYKEQVEEYDAAVSFNKKFDRIHANETCPYEKFNKSGGFRKVIPKVMVQPSYMEEASEVDLYEYYGIEEFHTSWMLNISPNWKGATINHSMIEFFKQVINTFFKNCNRFTKVNYVLENGHGVDHLHAHLVFVLNTKKPGYMTPIKNGKILTEWRNCWNRLAKSIEVDVTIDDEYIDSVDLCKARCAVNTCLLNNKEMYQDKLDYLCEDLKPESHKNDSHPLCPLRGYKGV
jgi:hypothetical protein